MTSRWQIVANERGVTGLKLRSQKKPAVKPRVAQAARWCACAEKELRAYFAGRLTSFAAPFDISALPPFTQAVLKVTANIPYGEVRSYEWVARQLGKPKAARAVGNALARNPIPIIIPCHRIVRTDGTIGVFALGPEWKKKLLSLEKRSGKSVTSRK
jgi:methylated-DNA-[protein]-cysteine S-methyltransferase